MDDARMGLDEAFRASEDSPAWRTLMDQAGAQSVVQDGVDPEVYAAAFNTPAGRAVLEDLYRRYVNVTRCIPGQGTDAAFYNEGKAQIVFEIIDNITRAENGEGNDQEG